MELYHLLVNDGEAPTLTSASLDVLIRGDNQRLRRGFAASRGMITVLDVLHRCPSDTVMLGQEIAPTEYDLRFRCLGFPVRVSPWFWLTSAILIWNWDDRLDYKLIGVLAVFISILIHELGHALAIRHYGGRSEIVLAMFGGYATCNVNPSRMGNIIIAAAGPAAGFLLWGVLYLSILLWGVLAMSGSQVPQRIAADHQNVHVLHNYLRFLLAVLLWANLSWSLLNLIPVWPLDGGRISHQVIGRFRAFDSWELMLKLSILVCAGMVSWCAFEFAQHGDGDRFMMIMFALLGFQNFQTLQASTRGRW